VVELTPNGAIDSYMTFDDYLDDEKFRIKSQDVFETVDIKLFKTPVGVFFCKNWLFLSKYLLTIKRIIAYCDYYKNTYPIPALNIPSTTEHPVSDNTTVNTAVIL
jgi:hypothetical protein